MRPSTGHFYCCGNFLKLTCFASDVSTAVSIQASSHCQLIQIEGVPLLHLLNLICFANVINTALTTLLINSLAHRALEQNTRWK